MYYSIEIDKVEIRHWDIYMNNLQCCILVKYVYIVWWVSCCNNYTFMSILQALTQAGCSILNILEQPAKEWDITLVPGSYVLYTDDRKSHVDWSTDSTAFSGCNVSQI